MLTPEGACGPLLTPTGVKFTPQFLQCIIFILEWNALFFVLHIKIEAQVVTM